MLVNCDDQATLLHRYTLSPLRTQQRLGDAPPAPTDLIVHAIRPGLEFVLIAPGERYRRIGDLLESHGFEVKGVYQLGEFLGGHEGHTPPPTDYRFHRVVPSGRSSRMIPLDASSCRILSASAKSFLSRASCRFLIC